MSKVKMRPFFQIRVTEGLDRGRVFPLGEQELTLGRRLIPGEEKSGFLFFEDPTVSRTHAFLEWNPSCQAYNLIHRSKTNPTRVNGCVVEECLLKIGDTVSMGDLSFVLEFLRPGESGDELIYSGIKLQVIEGRNKGETFALKSRLLLIGGRSDPEEASGENRILLDDPKLTLEEALLVWDEAHKRYDLHPAPSSTRPPLISRVEEGALEARLIKVNTGEVLLPQDLIILGDTLLMVMREERLLETIHGSSRSKAIRGKNDVNLPDRKRNQVSRPERANQSTKNT